MDWGLMPTHFFFSPSHIVSRPRLTMQNKQSCGLFVLYKCRKYPHFQWKYLCIFKVDSKIHWIYKLKQIYLPAGQCLSEAPVLLYTWKQAQRFNSDESFIWFCDLAFEGIDVLPFFHVHLIKWWYCISKIPAQQKQVQSRSDSTAFKLYVSFFERKAGGWAVSIFRVPFAFQHRTVDLLVQSVSSDLEHHFSFKNSQPSLLSPFYEAITKACHGAITKEAHYLKTMWHSQLYNQRKLKKLKIMVAQCIL